MSLVTRAVFNFPHFPGQALTLKRTSTEKEWAEWPQTPTSDHLCNWCCLSLGITEHKLTLSASSRGFHTAPRAVRLSDSSQSPRNTWDRPSIGPRRRHGPVTPTAGPRTRALPPAAGTGQQKTPTKSAFPQKKGCPRAAGNASPCCHSPAPAAGGERSIGGRVPPPAAHSGDGRRCGSTPRGHRRRPNFFLKSSAQGHRVGPNPGARRVIPTERGSARTAPPTRVPPKRPQRSPAPAVPRRPPQVPAARPRARTCPAGSGRRHSPRQMAVSGTSAPCRSSAAAAFSMAGRRHLPFGKGGKRSLLRPPAGRRSPGSRRRGGRLPPQPHGRARARRSGAGGGRRSAAPPLRRRLPTWQPRRAAAALGPEDEGSAAPLRSAPRTPGRRRQAERGPRRKGRRGPGPPARRRAGGFLSGAGRSAPASARSAARPSRTPGPAAPLRRAGLRGARGPWREAAPNAASALRPPLPGEAAPRSPA